MHLCEHYGEWAQESWKKRVSMAITRKPCVDRNPSWFAHLQTITCLISYVITTTSMPYHSTKNSKSMESKSTCSALKTKVVLSEEFSSIHSTYWEALANTLLLTFTNKLHPFACLSTLYGPSYGLLAIWSEVCVHERSLLAFLWGLLEYRWCSQLIRCSFE